MNERIRQIREELGLSRKEFGDKLGISQDVVNNLERGRIEIKDDRIKLICSMFNISENWLRTGEGNKIQEYLDEFTLISASIDKNDPKARQAIIDYWNLSEQDKELFWKFMERFMKNGKD